MSEDSTGPIQWFTESGHGLPKIPLGAALPDGRTLDDLRQETRAGSAVSHDAAYWLRKRVRVGAACAPSVTMAEGVVIAYAAAPTITVRDAEGRDSTWQVTLPIDVLGEVPDEELPSRAVDTEDRLNALLRTAGIEYPLGLRGVEDLIQQRDGYLDAAREAEELSSRTHESMMIKYAEAGQLRERAEEAERHLANVRVMVDRLRHAEPVGSATAGYCLVRIEDMLNGQEPT